MEKLAGGLLYLFTILTTLAMIGVLPAVLLSFAIERGKNRSNRRSRLWIAGFPLAYILGGFLGWTFLPIHWPLSFADTLRANSADHSIEYFAERVLLFALMTGSVAAWLYGIAAALIRRFPRGGARSAIRGSGPSLPATARRNAPPGISRA